MLNREQYYIDLIKPEYNILKIAGSSLGFKHSLKTLLKFKNRDLGTGYETIVLNKNNYKIIKYSSISETSRELNVSKTTILDYINSSKLLKNTYLIISPKSKISRIDSSSSDKNKDQDKSI